MLTDCSAAAAVSTYLLFIIAAMALSALALMLPTQLIPLCSVSDMKVAPSLSLHLRHRHRNVRSYQLRALDKILTEAGNAHF